MEVRSIQTIVRALNASRAQYLIVGGLAVNAHGYERFTKDLDLVIGLERENLLRALNGLMGIGYKIRIPVTPEQFADPNLREQLRREKNMVVLQLWSDEHQRTPIGVFVYEPFDFATEMKGAVYFPVGAEERAPVISLDALLELKRGAGRPQDLLDIEKLTKLRPYRDQP